MRRIIVAATLLIAVMVPARADFQEGVAAYKRGDYATALREWRPLAEQGYAGAQYNLGFMYHNGQGVPPDYAEAVKWYRLAAKQGKADAQFYLATMYRKGQGVLQDYSEAVRWYRLAAQQGDADAQHNLGPMYGEGHGVTRDYVQAHMWFNLAAAQGNELARKNRDIVADKMTPAQITEAQRSECDPRDEAMATENAPGTDRRPEGAVAITHK